MAGKLRLLVGLLMLSGSGGIRVSSNENPYTKIWTFSINDDWVGHYYMDDEGYIVGFQRELIAAVCEAAGIQCREIWTPWTWCWVSTPGQPQVAGKGLMRGWIDGCVGYVPSLGRIGMVDFSMPFLEPVVGYFFVKTGTENTFDANNIENKTIVFLDASAFDETCLARQSGLTGVFNIDTIYVAEYDEMAALISSGRADVGVNILNLMERYSSQVTPVLSRKILCSMGGPGIMTMKDNDLNTYWNIGFQKLRNSGKFTKMCQQAYVDHGHKFTEKIACKN